jgi:hypothetical protein
MKKTLGLIFGVLIFAANFNGFGQGKILTDSAANYVVIGAFHIKSHSDIWIKKAKESRIDAISAFNPNRKMYYVYSLRTEDRPKAFDEAERIRKDTPFWDTWVFGGSFRLNASAVYLDPITREPMKGSHEKEGAGNTKNSEERLVAGTGDSVDNTSGNSGSSSFYSDKTAKDAAIVADAAKKDSTEKVAAPTVDNNTGTAAPGAKLFLFKIHAAEGLNELIGRVDVVDLIKARRTGTYAGNKTVMVNPPNKSGDMSMVCQVFGYRKYQRGLNFFHPSDSGGVVIDSALVTVPFDLVRLQKGDFAVMYNVYFYKDAAVMRPESRYEVNSLVDMMKENPKYKIRIHGHTNGNAAGKVTSMGDSKNFFSLTGTKEGYGSAKKLSEERAIMMRQYLVEAGIDEKRMDIKAWGGKKPVYDKMSPQAQANVRVEIEILEDK